MSKYIRNTFYTSTNRVKSAIKYEIVINSIPIKHNFRCDVEVISSVTNTLYISCNAN